MTTKTVTAIPPLSQSLFEQMACPFLYATKQVRGLPQTTSEAAERGRVIHEVIRDYIRHLIETKQPTDYAKLDELVEASPYSEEVAEVLEKFKTDYFFDPEELFAAELPIRLTENFQPIIRKDSHSIAAYQGTLDLFSLESPTVAIIDDWKSYWQVVAPDSFQAQFYPLLLMCLNPGLERVIFRLQFVRYGVSRQVEYTRADLPKLKKIAERERARQLRYHEEATTGREDLPAAPGRQCTYCPLVANGCPMATTNPYATMIPEERVQFGLYLEQAKKENDCILKDHVNQNGPVLYIDGAGNRFEGGFKLKTQKSYPLVEGTAVLDRWMLDTHEDLRGKLTIGGLSSPIKAKKRAALKEQMEAVAEETSRTEFGIRKAKAEQENNAAD